MTTPGRIRLLALPLLAVLLYLPALSGGFLAWDDRALVLENPVVQKPLGEALGAAFSGPTGTVFWPLRDLSYALDRALWGWNPLGFHLTNLLLYAALVAALLWAVPGNWGGRGVLLGVLLFTVHPLHAEPVSWISGRKDLLAALFVVLAWGVLREPEEALGGRRLLRLMLGFVLYLAACLSKTSALPFPLAWWLQDRLLPGRRRWTVLERLPFLAALGLFGAHQAVLALGSGTAGVYQGDLEGMKRALATPVRSLLDQVWAVLLPLDLSPAYAAGPGRWGAWAWISWAGGLALAFFAARALHSAWRRGLDPEGRRLLAALGWAALFFLPVLNLAIPTALPRADRYAFLPSVGLCVALGSILEGVRLSRAGLAGLCASLALLSAHLGRRWTSDVALWGPAVRRDPAGFHAAGGLAWGYALAGDLPSARRALERLVRTDPESPVARHQLAGLCRRMGDTGRAFVEYAQALRLYGERPKGRSGVVVPGGYRREHARCLAELASMLDPAQARPRLEEALRIAEDEPAVWSALALCKAALGDLPGAAAAADRGVALAQGSADAHWARARIAQREAEEALASGDGPRAQERFRAVVDGCRRMREAGQETPEVLSRLAYAEACLAGFAGSPREEVACLQRAAAALGAIPPEARTSTDLRNLAGLLRVRAEADARAGDHAHAYAAAHAACDLVPDDPGLHRLAAAEARAIGREDLARPHELLAGPPVPEP